MNPTNQLKATYLIADELIAKHFPEGLKPGDLSQFVPTQRNAIRALTLEALAYNAKQGNGVPLVALKAQTKLNQEILQDALEFEKTLEPGTDTTRVVSSVFPWGWRYKWPSLQTQFRRHRQNNIKA